MTVAAYLLQGKCLKIDLLHTGQTVQADLLQETAVF